MLDAAQRAHFATEGWLVVPGVVPPDLIRAAQEAAALQAGAEPRPGPLFAFPSFADSPALAALWTQQVQQAVADLTDPVVAPVGCQLAMTFPPFPRGAGRPHVDGTAGEVGARPGTFTLLAGFPLNDQSGPGSGGLWVWPGSHREHAAHFAAYGPEAFWDGDPGYPDVATAAPVQIAARPGDLVLAHYLLGHCPGGVDTEARTTVYLRLTHRAHASTWRAAMTDADHDFGVLAG